MSKIYFISDAHLGLGSREEDREKEQRLIAFLRSIAADASQLFILGDLFDAWIEYRTVIPKGHHRILTALDELVSSGVAVHYLCGNHDFWMRDYFSDELGIHTYRDPMETILVGKRFYLHHGDGLALNDTGYRILKKILRNRFNIWWFSWLHPDIGLRLAKGSSKKSRHYTANKEYGEHDGMVKAATEKIGAGFDFVIMGHRHEPTYLPIGDGVYINLGDWITHLTYAVYEEGIVSLKTWK